MKSKIYKGGFAICADFEFPLTDIQRAKLQNLLKKKIKTKYDKKTTHTNELLSKI